MAHARQRLGAAEAVLAILQQFAGGPRLGDVGDRANDPDGGAASTGTFEESLRPRVHPAHLAAGADDAVLEAVAAVAVAVVGAATAAVR